MGQVAVIRPGRPFSRRSMAGRTSRDPAGSGNAIRQSSFTPAAVAAWQVAEAVKLLSGMGASLDGALLLIDLFSGETTRIALKLQLKASKNGKGAPDASLFTSEARGGWVTTRSLPGGDPTCEILVKPLPGGVTK